MKSVLSRTVQDLAKQVDRLVATREEEVWITAAIVDDEEFIRREGLSEEDFRRCMQADVPRTLTFDQWITESKRLYEQSQNGGPQ